VRGYLGKFRPDAVLPEGEDRSCSRANPGSSPNCSEPSSYGEDYPVLTASHWYHHRPHPVDLAGQVLPRRASSFHPFRTPFASHATPQRALFRGAMPAPPAVMASPLAPRCGLAVAPPSAACSRRRRGVLPAPLRAFGTTAAFQPRSRRFRPGHCRSHSPCSVTNPWLARPFAR